MSFETLVAITCIFALSAICYLLCKKPAQRIVRNWIHSVDPPGQRLDVNQYGDVENVERISAEEKKYKRQQLIRSRLEYRQITSTPSPLCETLTNESNLRVKEISPRDLESGKKPREFSDTAHRKLAKMGYDVRVCEKALKAVGGSDVEAAVYWIFENKTNKVTTATNEFPPEGIPIVKSWEENENGGIRGRIYGSPKFEDGDFVETSEIVEGVIQNNSIVATKSGNCYFLSAESAEITIDDDDIGDDEIGDDEIIDDEISTHSRLDSTHSRLDSTHSRLDACRYDCVACRRESANHSVRSRLDSLDSAHSRRDSASHSMQCRKDSLDSLYSGRDSAENTLYSRRDSADHSLYSRRDSADHSRHSRLDSVDSAHNRGDEDNTIKSTQSISATNATSDTKSQEVCSICLEPYRPGDIVVRLKQKRKVKDAKWFQDTLSQLKNRTSCPNYNEDTGSNQWFDDIVSQLKDATEEIQKSSKPTTCNHWFREECILEWLETHDDCPLCRINMLRDD